MLGCAVSPERLIPMRFPLCAVLALLLPFAAQAQLPALADSVHQQVPSLTETYKHLHRTPELSRHEEQTSAFLAAELRKLGYTVTAHVGQPSEEATAGAAAMLADHLYERFGQPDYVLSEHDTNDVPAGSIAIKSGPLMASATSLNVTMRGIGGHGSRPEDGKDPVVLAAEFVLVAQTIVSRQVDPQQPSVLTIGTINGGTKNNIIPDDVTMGLSLRSYSISQRDQIIADIRRTAKGLAVAYGIPDDRMPTVSVVGGTPVTNNDPSLAERVRTSAVKALGASCVQDAKPVMGSEDVGRFTLDGKIPGMMFWLGAADPAKLAESRKSGVPLPSQHSALFAPVYAEAIPTGVTAMTTIALDLLK